jgi:hypothetical protein
MHAPSQDSLSPRCPAEARQRAPQRWFPSARISSGRGDCRIAFTSRVRPQNATEGALSLARRNDHEITDSHCGVGAQVERANQRVEYSLESRTKTIDTLLHEWKNRPRSHLDSDGGRSLDADRPVWRHGDTGLPRCDSHGSGNASANCRSACCKPGAPVRRRFCCRSQTATTQSGKGESQKRP